MKLRRRTKLIFAGGLTVIAIIAMACGSSTDLTQTQVFQGFGFSIDYPAGWTASEGPGDSTQLNEFEEDSGTSTEPPGSERKGYEVTFNRATLAFLRSAGLSAQPTLDELLSLNSRTFGWEVLDTSNISVFEVPALSVTINSPQGAGIAVLGIVEEEAFLLSLIAPTGGSVDEFLPTWTSMLESIKPVTEAVLSAEDQYFEDVSNALSLTAAKLGRFGTIFGETYETRQRLIDSLLEAGVGTAFVDTSEALQSIEPPDQHRAEHEFLVEHYLELVSLDERAAQYVEEGDVAGFVLINGQLGEVSATFGASLPMDFCNSISGLGTPACAPELSPDLGEYETQLGRIFSMSRPQVFKLIGTLGFPLSLTAEENTRVIAELAPDITTLLAGLQTEVNELSPPDEFTTDHERLAQYIDQLAEVFNELVLAGIAGELGITPGPLQSILEVSCPAATSFSSPEFMRLVGDHFSDMGCSPPFELP